MLDYVSDGFMKFYFLKKVLTSLFLPEGAWSSEHTIPVKRILEVQQTTTYLVETRVKGASRVVRRLGVVPRAAEGLETRASKG